MIDTFDYVNTAIKKQYSWHWYFEHYRNHSPKSGLESYLFCESNPVDKWPGEGSIDYVHYYNGLKFIRNFTDWNNGFGYELLIGTSKGRKSKVIWLIDKIDNTSSDLNITIYSHDAKRSPSFAKPIIYYLYIKPTLHKYLSSVLKGFRWYITKNERVRKNQFGTHKWFSKWPLYLLPEKDKWLTTITIGH